MEVATKNLVDPVLMLLASSGYCYVFARKIPKGFLRVFSLLPVFYLFSIVPWFSSSSFLRGIISFFITWIASFKLLLFCFNQGPLFACKNYFAFVAVTYFPVKIKENNSYSNTSGLKTLPKLVGVFPLFLLKLYLQKEKYPSQIILLLYGVSMLYVITLFQALGKYELVQLFNKPYSATSLQDFWGRRWNRLSSNILRQTIYEPTRNTVKGIAGARPAKVVALIFTLAVSGIMHEAIFYYVTCGKRPTWEVTLFFVLHAICMIFEGSLKNLGRVKGWGSVHPGVSVGFTLGFVLVTFYWLLVLPVWRSAQNECVFKIS